MRAVAEKKRCVMKFAELHDSTLSPPPFSIDVLAFRTENGIRAANYIEVFEVHDELPGWGLFLLPDGLS